LKDGGTAHCWLKTGEREIKRHVDPGELQRALPPAPTVGA
jgi:hypothetical protein